MNQRDDLGEHTPGDLLAIPQRGQDWRFPGCYGQGVPACTGVPEAVAVLDKHAAVGDVAIVTGQLGAVVGTRPERPPSARPELQGIHLSGAEILSKLPASSNAVLSPVSCYRPPPAARRGRSPSERI